jgi:hypothetical protein
MECKEEEGLTIEVAMDRALVFRSIEALVRPMFGFRGQG